MPSSLAENKREATKPIRLPLSLKTRETVLKTDGLVLLIIQFLPGEELARSACISFLWHNSAHNKNAWKYLQPPSTSRVTSRMNPVDYCRTMHTLFIAEKTQILNLFTNAISGLSSGYKTQITVNFRHLLDIKDFIIAFKDKHITPSFFQRAEFSEHLSDVFIVRLQDFFRGCGLRLMKEKKITSEILLKICNDIHCDKVKHIFSNYELAVKVLNYPDRFDMFYQMSTKDFLKLNEKNVDGIVPKEKSKCLVM